MQPRRALVFVSAMQLTAGLAGQLIALRDRRSFDIPALRWAGSSQRVARDSWLLGTALSAPIVMLATQALCTARLAAGPSHVAARTLEGLGIAMSCGYLIEREVEAALSPRGWDPVLTPIAAAGLSSALAMAVLGGLEAGERVVTARDAGPATWTAG